MAHGRDKDRSREHRAKVRQILMDVWDPIGVRDIPEAAEEYDGYVGAVYLMLVERRASVEELAAWLSNIATDRMGLSPHPDRDARHATAAEALVALRPGFGTP